MFPIKKYKIAIVGSSLAGLIAARALSRQHTVEIFESAAQLGGALTTDKARTNSSAMETPLPLIFAPKTHPNFNATLAQLGLKTMRHHMNFSYHAQGSGLLYSNNIFGIMTQPKQVMTKSYTRMIREIIYFHYRAKKDLQTLKIPQQTMQEYLSGHTYSDMFIQTYFIPLTLGIGPATEILTLPAHLVLEKLNRHGVLGFGKKPHYKIVSGGYTRYVQEIMARWNARYHLNTPVLKIHRHADTIEIETPGGKHPFDYVIIAISADRILDILQTPTDNEFRLLSPWRYATGTHIQHTDTSLLPQNRALWGIRHCSHNENNTEYLDYINTYQITDTNTFLSSYPENSSIAHPSPDTILATTPFRYPLLSKATRDTQSELPLLNGQERSFFCGPYFGDNTSEDAVTSAIQVLHHFNTQL